MSPSPAEELLAIGHVARPHGVRGELSVLPLAPAVIDPDDLITERELILRDPKGKRRPVRGEWVRPHQERWLVKLEGIDDMTAADLLRGCDLCLLRSELPELPEGWYYEADLEGCRVIDERLGEIGTVLALELGYVQPQLKIKRPDGSHILVPWRDALFPAVDLAAKTISARLPVGLPGLEDEA